VFPDNEQGGEGPLEAEVKWYNARKGFGFVLGPDGQDVFFHASALTEAGIEPPETGDKFMCEIGSDRQGRRLVTRIHSMTKGPGGGDRPRGGFGDRPPRRDFGGGGGGGGFGAPRSGGFGDRAPRRDFGRDEGGPTYGVNGTVKWFDQVRGFGFVTPDDGGQDVFLHSSVLQRAGRVDVQQGEKVALDVRDGQRGRQAVTIK
jgi:CspA family cold shock protein